jgi:ferredoxin-nitrite reductase
VEFIRPTRKGGELNQVERWKLERHPFEVAAAVRDRYAVEGPEAIAGVPGEMERLKWVGLYPQRQGGDAFMLRVKVPGGRMSAAQARRLGEVVDAFAHGRRPAHLGSARRGGDNHRAGVRGLGSQRARLPGRGRGC